MKNSIKLKNRPNVGLKDVLKAFWVGIKPNKFGFYVTILTYIIGSIADLINPLIYKRFFDVLTSTADKISVAQTLIHILFIILGLNLISWAAYNSGQITLDFFETKVMARLRENSFDYMIDHSYSFFSDNFTGALVQRVGRFTRAFEKLYDTFIINLVPLFITVIGIIYVVWTQEPKIAMIMSAWAVIVMIISYFFSRWKLKFDLRSSSADSKSSGYLADVITNQNAVATFAASDFESEGFKKLSTEQAEATTKTYVISTLMNTIQVFLVTIIEFLLFYYAVKYWKTNVLTVGTFVLIQVYIISLAQKLWSLSNIIRNFYEGFSDSKEMVEILKLPHDIKDTENAKPIDVTGGSIEFKNVSFEFNSSRKILQDLNLVIQAGEKVALIGPSGAGKSTIVKLLLRTYDINNGSILVDNQNIKKVTQESLRRNISVVPQDPVLFHRSLMENIRYGKLDATDEEVVNASRLAHCEEFIDSLPDRYETFVGERGIKLSGGERQRVAIARAILKNAPILILDEATSSLDSHSEALIQDALGKLMEGKTSIVIAHRLSTIRKMDRIIVVEKGRISEEGTHSDLISRKESLYKNLWDLQAGGFLAN